MRRKHSRRGFSLVELLVTTLIIGGCYGGLAQLYTDRRFAADNRACESTRRQLYASLEAWNIAHGKSADLTQALPQLVAEGYVSHRPKDPGSPLADSAGNFTSDAQGVSCRVHPLAPAQAKPVEYPSLWLPLLMFGYALLRYLIAFAKPRALVTRVAMPVMDPLSGPIGAARATQRTAVLCSFCLSNIQGEILKVNGKPMHADCGAFAADELER